MSLQAGVRLGPYEVVSPIDAGGMGEVYRARDTRLGRTVALKVMRDELLQEASSRGRFEREARSAAALNHPHICAIHDVGIAALDGRGEVPYLVLELLEGESLAARLARGAMSLDEAVNVARQVLLALVAAHRAGLVHRDLKPANVMLTKGGVKLLDFGLAKPAAPPRSAEATASTRAAQPITGPASLVGTPHYMAPEQLEGHEADARADLWALGVMLYEMLTGQRPFSGESTASLVGAILKDQPPPVSARRQLTPPALDHVVGRALAKDPEERWQSARDLLDALERLAAPEVVPDAGRTISGHSRWPALAAGLILGAIASAGAFIARQGATPPAPPVLTLDLPVPSYFRSPGQIVGRPELWLPSPDGRWLLGTRETGDGRWQLVLRDVRTGVSRPLDSTSGMAVSSQASWSADSSSVAYFDASDGTVKRVVVDTGSVMPLMRARDCRGVAWWGSNVICADNAGAGGSSWVAVDATTRAQVAVEVGAQPASYPTPLGDDRFLARRGRDTVRLGLRGETPVIVVPGGNSSVFAEGHLLFVSQDWLVAQRLDPASLMPLGEPIRLLAGVQNDVATGPAVRASEHVVTAVVDAGAYAGVWIGRADFSRTPTPAVLGVHGAFTGRLFQDRILATSLIDPASGNPDVWTIDMTSGARQRVLQSPDTWDSHPRWSADGRSLVFRSARRILLAEPGAAATTPRVVAADIPGLERLDDWSPDGRTVLASVNQEVGRFNIVAVDVGTGALSPFQATAANEGFASISPDGRLVAYASDESGASEVYVRPFDGADTQRVSSAGGGVPRWSANGRRLYFLAPDGWLMEAAVKAEPRGVSFSPPSRVVPARGVDFTPSADDSRFLVFDRQAEPRAVAIVNWKSLLPVQ
jgi:serine/threonine protein kinase